MREGLGLGVKLAEQCSAMVPSSLIPCSLAYLAVASTFVAAAFDVGLRCGLPASCCFGYEELAARYGRDVFGLLESVLLCVSRDAYDP